MALCEMHLKQDNALNKMTSLTIITPNGKPGPFPVLYLLHGLSDDHTAWQRWTSIERYVEQYPLMVVMPNSERGFYTDAVDRRHAAFETLILQDIIGFVDRTFQTIPTREGRVVAGLSMGGYGALKFALKRPDLFCAAVSHSGAVEFASQPFSGEDWGQEWVPVFGKDPAGSDNDLYALAERIDRTKLPALRIDCGTDDFLIEHNRRFHTRLTEMGISHEYEEHPGAHNWEYWDRHIQDTVAFFAQELRLTKAGA